MLAVLRSILAEAMEFSRASETPYQTVVIGLAHAHIGTLVAALVSPQAFIIAAVVRMVFPALYWIKERNDIRRGGSIRDSIWDGILVFIGGWWPAPWVPVVALIVAVASAMDRRSRD